MAEDLDSLLTGMAEIHPSPFRVHPIEEWTAAARAIERRSPWSRSHLYAQVLRLIALANDGHTDAYPPDSHDEVRATIPLKLVLFPEGLHVVAASAEFREALGGEVVSIEGRPAHEVLARLSNIVPSDNEWGKGELLEDYVRMPVLLRALGIANASPGLQLELRDGRQRTRITVDSTDYRDELPVGPPRRPVPPGWLDVRDVRGVDKPIWQRELERPYWYQPLRRLNALYVQINSVRETETGAFARFVERLPHPSASGLSRLILDLRTNRGGDATLVLPLVQAVVQDWDHLDPGKVFVLTSNRTFSAAVHLAADLERQTNAIFVGESTGAPPNHYADVALITLPNSGIEVEISSLYWQKSDPRDARSAIHPDVVAPSTWDAFVNGRDPALEAIASLEAEDERLRRERSPVFNWLRETQSEPP